MEWREVNGLGVWGLGSRVWDVGLNGALKNIGISSGLDTDELDTVRYSMLCAFEVIA